MKTPPIELAKNRLQQSISDALGFLHESQLAYGEFKTYASSEEDLAGCFDSSPFVTALILYSIGFCHEPRVRTMTTRGLDFLSAEMEGSGLWRYWSSRNEQHEFLPPDLDDTCCISFVLARHRKPIPGNRELILANRNADGAFHTWMVPRSTSPPELRNALYQMVSPGLLALTSLAGFSDHVDRAVNANVLLYLGESAETKRAIDCVIGAASEETPPCGEYYLHWLSFYYMLSRAYFNGVCSLVDARPIVAHRIIATQCEEGSWGNELRTALAACALLNFDVRAADLDRAAEYLIQSQRANGSWRRIPMFLGPAPYYGSEELTTALAVETLARYSARFE